jgi:hypothetical protein
LIENIEVRCAVPVGQTANAVKLLTPDSDASVTPDFRMQGPMAVFSIPKLNTYCVALISW